jgi:hypothetical protein
MAEQEPSKLKTGVRFSSPALGRINEQVQKARAGPSIRCHGHWHAQEAIKVTAASRAIGSLRPIARLSIGSAGRSAGALSDTIDDVHRVMLEIDPGEFRALLGDDEVTFRVDRSYDLASEEFVWSWTWDESGPPDAGSAPAAS